MNILQIIAGNVGSIFLLGAEWTDFSSRIVSLLKDWWAPLIAVFAAIAVIWGVYIGWGFWSAGGDEQKIVKAKKNLMNFIIGIVLIFVIAGLTPVLVAAFQTWLSNS